MGMSLGKYSPAMMTRMSADSTHTGEPGIMLPSARRIVSWDATTCCTLSTVRGPMITPVPWTRSVRLRIIGTAAWRTRSCPATKPVRTNTSPAPARLKFSKTRLTCTLIPSTPYRVPKSHTRSSLVSERKGTSCRLFVGQHRYGMRPGPTYPRCWISDLPGWRTVDLPDIPRHDCDTDQALCAVKKVAELGDRRAELVAENSVNILGHAADHVHELVDFVDAQNARVRRRAHVPLGHRPRGHAAAILQLEFHGSSVGIAESKVLCDRGVEVRPLRVRLAQHAAQTGCLVLAGYGTRVRGQNAEVEAGLLLRFRMPGRYGKPNVAAHGIGGGIARRILVQ